MESTSKIKVIVCDDHVLFRQGIKASLSYYQNIDVIGEAGDGIQLMHLLKHMAPDVILLDINMPIMDGIETLPKLKQEYPDIKVVIVSMHNNASMISKMLALGANSYLTKGDMPETIYESICGVYRDDVYFTPLMNKAMLKATQENDILKTMDVRSEIKKEEPKVEIAPEVEQPITQSVDRSAEILERIVKKLDEIEQRSNQEDKKPDTILHWENPNENDTDQFQWGSTLKKGLVAGAVSAAVILLIWGILKWKEIQVSKTNTLGNLELPKPDYEYREANQAAFQTGNSVFGR
jgi:DNA-binding NarL/FixJ family response regulator